MRELKAKPRRVLSGAAQSCSWKEKLPRVTPKIRNPRAVMRRSFPMSWPGEGFARMSSIR